MAINKKEAAAHAKEIDELKHRLALCWTPEVRPDVPPPTGFGSELTKGWLPCYDRVEPCCSSSSLHSKGNVTETNTQGSRALYSTRLLALYGVRNEMERRFAADLKRIDEWIKQEQQTPTPLPAK